MNEIKMTVKEAIEQLDDLKRDREGFAKNDEHDSVFDYDIKAIDVAIKALEDNIKLNKMRKSKTAKLNITILLKMLRIGVKQPKNKTSG